MFIPRGKAVHENLATSYVMVDALVEDLCEGGFSGVVEVLLRNADGHVLIDRGNVAAVVEQREAADDSTRDRFVPTTVAELAVRSRGERGRVSVYGFPPGATAALAGLLDAESLYTALSTDFADLEKMIAKLRRESDRQWFIEVTTQSGNLALIHIEDDRCRVMRSDGAGDQNDGPGSDSAGLKELLDECNRVGGAFDVYFKRPGAALAPTHASTTEAHSTPLASDAILGHESALQQSDAAALGSFSPDETTDTEFDLVHLDDASPLAGTEAEEPPFLIEPNHDDGESESDAEVSEDKDSYWSRTTAEPLFSVAASARGVESMVVPVSTDVDEIAAEEASLAMVALSIDSEPVDVEEAEAMAEIKRLMSEIARTIDEACRSVEQRDAFSMYLRAGQLKIADRYPFLDPFGAEFEYLSGEIAFVGKASPSQFKEGLTEGLRLAVVGVAQSSAQPARLRAYVKENLRKLLERLRGDLERFGLDESIEQIMSF